MQEAEGSATSCSPWVFVAALPLIILIAALIVIASSPGAVREQHEPGETTTTNHR